MIFVESNKNYAIDMHVLMAVRHGSKHALNESHFAKTTLSFLSFQIEFQDKAEAKLSLR